jgi:hypothetical protein
MEILTIKLKNDTARKLIQDLEALNILEVVKAAGNQQKVEFSNISDLKSRISTPMGEEEIEQQLGKIRNEWQPNI